MAVTPLVDVFLLLDGAGLVVLVGALAVVLGGAVTICSVLCLLPKTMKSQCKPWGQLLGN